MANPLNSLLAPQQNNTQQMSGMADGIAAFKRMAGMLNSAKDPQAALIHAEAVKAIDKQRTIAEPPAVMKELWSIEHKYYMEHAAATKAMLDLYAK